MLSLKYYFINMIKYIKIEESWKKVLYKEFKKNYMKELKEFLIHEKKNYKIYQKDKEIFNAFNQTPLGNVKIVVLGQDPYHGEKQNHGLSFCSKTKPPPSLVNIYKEIEEDLGITNYDNGDLTRQIKSFIIKCNINCRQ